MINGNNLENPRLHFNLKVSLTKLLSSKMKCFSYYLLLYLLTSVIDFQVNIVNFLLISISFSKCFFRMKQIRDNHVCNLILMSIYDIVSFSSSQKSHNLFFISIFHEIYYEKNDLLKFYLTHNVHNIGKLLFIAMKYFYSNAPLFPLVSNLIISNFEICLLMSLSEELSKIFEDYFRKVVEMFKVMDSYPVGILIMKKGQYEKDSQEPQAKVIFANKKAEEILETEILADEPNDMVNNEFIAKASSYIIQQKSPQSMKTEKSLLNEISMFNSSVEPKCEKYCNNEKMIIVHLSTVNNKYKILSFENLTEERKKMQNNLFKNLKSQFLITISHELNNPLSGLINYSEKLTSTQFEDIDKKRKILEKLKKFKFYIKFFIKDLTLFSKIILKENLNISPTNLNLFFILTKTLAKFRIFFESKQIKIQSDIRLCKNFVVYYDFDLFKFLLKNLFMLILYRSEHNHNFILDSEINKEKSTVQLTFHQSSATNVNIYQYLNCQNEENEEVMSINKSLQTYEMLKEIVSTLSSLLNIKVNFREKFVKMEFEYKHIESLSDEENFFEFSPETIGKNILNFQKIGRVIKSKSNFISEPYNTDSEVTYHALDVNSKRYYSETDNQDLYTYHVNIHDLIDTKGLEKIKRMKNKGRSHPSFELSLTEIPDQEKYPKFIKKGSNSKFKTQASKLQSKKLLSNCFIDIVEQENYHQDSNDSNLGSIWSCGYNSSTPAERINLAPNGDTAIRNKTPNFTTKAKDDIRIVSRKKTKMPSAPPTHKLPINVTINNLTSYDNPCNCNEILIVDDENFNVNAIKSIMKKHKISADFCFNGQEAVVKVESDFQKTCCRKRYKLIFMDIMMPILDGIAASKQINCLYEKYKAETTHAKENIDLSIVVISAHDVEEISQRVKGINLVKDFASKPVRKSKIEEFLNRFYYPNFIKTEC